MSVLLAVDPGIRGCGVALFKDEQLSQVSYIRNPIKEGNTAEASSAMGWAVFCWNGLANTIVLEWPRVYASRIREGKSKTDPNDLLTLSAVDAAIASFHPGTAISCFSPSEWKGQLSHEAVVARVRSRLSSVEREILDGVACPKSLRHNVEDAVGIGLHFLGRFTRRRVI